MRVQTAVDWDKVGAELRNNMHAAPTKCRKDLSRMLGHIEGLVQKLGAEEVVLRRTKKATSPVADQFRAQINESINEYEKWLMLAYLQHG
jgi:hypothetical protein